MQSRIGWSRSELLIAFKLYCELPFGKMHSRNPTILEYADLIGRTSSALAMKLTNIASLDPVIRSSGRTGLTGASAADKAMWDEMQANWEHFAVEIEKAEITLNHSRDLGESKWALPETEQPITDFSARDKVIQTTARVGQEFFRRTVLSTYDSSCCISGLALPKLLVASHIVPWSIDPLNRLNPQNGLCLSTLHDRAFDLGIITIDEKMIVRISKKYSDETNHFFDQAIASFDGKEIILPKKFSPSLEFLEYHRLHIFEG